MAERPTPARPACPDCHRVLSSATSLQRHRENYCRYREGMRARPSVVHRKRNVVAQIEDEEFDGGVTSVVRTRISANGRARDYEMKSNDVVYDAERWLNAEEMLVKRVHDEMNEFLIKGRLVLKAWFVKRNPATLEVLQREVFYLSSLPADFIHDFHQWYTRHILGIIKNLENFTKQDSNLEFDSVEALDIKFNLLRNLSGRCFFQLPDNLKNMKAVINVEVKKECFKYALLSILHYNDLTKNRTRPSKYEQWLGELNFGDVDPSEVHIKRDIPKIEKLNNLKINVHVWEKGELQGCAYNDRKVLSEKTVNLLLVIGNQGERHYCGIPSLSRLYFHTKSSHNMQHV